MSQAHRRVVSKEDIAYLSDNLHLEWRDIARELGLPEAEIYIITRDYSGNLKEQIYHMFLCWKQREGLGATHGRLIRALMQAGRADLADNLRRYEQGATSYNDSLGSSGKDTTERHIMSQAHGSVVSIEDILWLSKKLGKEWRGVCRNLGMETSELEQLHESNKGNPEEVNFQSLLKWRRSKGSAATVGILSDALKKENRTDLAEHILSNADLSPDHD